MIAHGLCHAVLPLRGAGMLEGDSWTYALTVACYTLAINGFVAAGAGALGVSPFRRFTWWLTLVAATSSMIAFRMLGDVDLWPGMVLDLTLPIAATFLVATPQPMPALHGFRRLLQLASHAIIALIVLYIATASLLWPWHRHWGTTPGERAMSLPGDPVERQSAFELMHGVSIDAPPEDVWPWLVQIGTGPRGVLQLRLAGAPLRRADSQRRRNQTRMAEASRRRLRSRHAARIPRRTAWRGPRLVCHRGASESRARVALLGRVRSAGERTRRDPSPDPVHHEQSPYPVWAAAVSFTAFELPHFIMERRMLLGIKERAEARRSAS